jgi:hypothetical protein
MRAGALPPGRQRGGGFFPLELREDSEGRHDGFPTPGIRRTRDMDIPPLTQCGSEAVWAMAIVVDAALRRSLGTDDLHVATVAALVMLALGGLLFWPGMRLWRR